MLKNHFKGFSYVKGQEESIKLLADLFPSTMRNDFCEAGELFIRVESVFCRFCEEMCYEANAAHVSRVYLTSLTLFTNEKIQLEFYSGS